MTRRQGRSRKPADHRGTKSDPRPRTVSEGVTVHAVHAPSGRPATTVHVEVDAERLKRTVHHFDKVEGVVAEFPNAADGDDVRWEDQRLDKTGEDVRPGGERTLHYSGTRYDACDAPRYGIGVRVETPEGPLETRRSPGAVHDADKPGEGD